MTVILDTTAVIAVVINEPHRPALLAATANADLVAPSSLHWEIGNAFSAMFKQHRLTLDQAKQALSLYSQIPIRLVDVFLGTAIEMAAALKIYAYDAYVLACAAQENAPLLTLDSRLRAVAAQAGVTAPEIVP